MNKDQATQISLFARLLEGESVEEANTHNADDVQHILADPGYAGALLKQLYEGDRFKQFNYKAAHYDADIKAKTLADPDGEKFRQLKDLLK